MLHDAIPGFRVVHVMVMKAMWGELFAVVGKDMRGCSCPCQVKEHILLNRSVFKSDDMIPRRLTKRVWRCIYSVQRLDISDVVYVYVLFQYHREPIPVHPQTKDL